MGTAAWILDGTMPGEALTREQFAVILDKLGLIPSATEEKEPAADEAEEPKGEAADKGQEEK